MKKEVIHAKSIPESVGPYSQVIGYCDLLFISGQVAVDMNTGEVVRGSVAEQTAIVMDIIKNTLEEVGSCMDKIIKCTVHLSDRKYFSEMNEVYRKYFTGDYPARLCVSGVQLYDGLDVEIDVIASK
ncbi:MAG TPA: Rid family detoxifying hydrolase [Candidatus Acidoferrum sp.]|nr:Rid family detoxifying hydrolase [Candidatus Acidoferrum sp.]